MLRAICNTRVLENGNILYHVETTSGINWSFIILYCNNSLNWTCWLPLQWRHNERDRIPNHQHHDCLLDCLFRRPKKTSKLSVTGLCEGIHQWPVNFPPKGPVTRKMFPFDDVIMSTSPESYIALTNWRFTVSQYFCTYITGLILDLRPSYERRCCFVTTSLIGWVQAKNQPCIICTIHYFDNKRWHKSNVIILLMKTEYSGQSN